MALIPSYEKKSKHIKFVGREEYIDLFDSKIQAVKSRNLSVLNYYGIGGIGKSSLLKELVKKSNSNSDIISINYNFDDNISKDKVFENIANTLSQKKVKLLYFGIAYSIYWSKINPHTELQKSHLPFLEEGSFLGDAISSFGGAESLGVAGGILNLIDKNLKKFKDLYEMESDKKDELDELEFMSNEDISELLPKFLSYDLKNHTAKNPHYSFAFFFDTYEVLWESVKKEHQKVSIDLWFRDLVIALNGLNTIFVVMGREKLLWADDEPEWAEYISYKQLGGLVSSESKKLLISEDIKEEQIINTIIEASEGVPFYLSLSIDTYKGLKDPKVEDFDATTQHEVFERFLRYLDKDELLILDLLSVPRFFTDSLFKSLKDKFVVGYVPSKSILNYSFISQKDDRYYMHKLMQSGVQNRIDSDDIENFHKFLFEYYDKFLEDKNMDSDEYLQNLKEAMYHYANITDDGQIIEWFEGSIKKLRTDGAYSMVISSYGDFIGYLQEQENQKEQLINLGLIYMKIKDLESVKKITQELSDGLPDYLLSKVYYLQATYFEQSNNLSEAKKYYERSINYSINDEEMMMDIYVSLGNIHRKSRNSSKTIYFLSKAQNIAKQNSKYKLNLAKIYDKFGFFYRDKSQKRYDEAQEIFLKSLAIKTDILKEDHIEIAKVYKALAELGVQLGTTGKSIELINKAVKPFSDTYGLKSSNTLGLYNSLVKILIADDSIDKYISMDINPYINKTYLYASLAKEMSRLKNDERYEEFIEKAKELCHDEHELLKLYELLYVLFFNIRKNDQIEKYMLIRIDLLNKNQESKKLAKLYGELGNFYLKSNKYELSKKYFKLQCDTNENINEPISLSKSYGYLANFYLKTKDINKAEEFFIKQYETIQNHTNTKARADAYKIMAKFYIKQKNFEKADEYFSRCLKLWKKDSNHAEVISIYEDLANVQKYKNDPEKELHYLTQELSYNEENSKTNIHRLDKTYGKLIEFYEREDNFNMCEKYYLLQIEVRKQYKTNPTKLAKGYSFLATFYRKKGKIKEAEENCFKQLEAIKTTNDLQKIANSYDHIISFYESQSDKEITRSKKENSNIDKSIIEKELQYRLIQYQIRIENNLYEDAASSCKGLASCYNKLLDQNSREKYLYLRIEHLKSSKDTADKADAYMKLGIFYRNKRDIKNAKKQFIKYLDMWDTEKNKETSYQLLLNFFKENKNVIKLDEYTKDKILNLIQKDDYKTVAIYTFFLSRFYKNRQKELFKFFHEINMKVFDKDIDKQLSAFQTISTSLSQWQEIKASSYFFDKVLKTKMLIHKDEKDKLIDIYEQAIILFEKRDEKIYIKLYRSKLKDINI